MPGAFQHLLRGDKRSLEWQAKAARRDVPNPDAIFFPIRGKSSRPARELCATCPVQEECKTYGRMEIYGIWGGTTERERRALSTVTTMGAHHALVVPLRKHGSARPVDEPLPTVAAEGNHHALIVRNYGPPEKAGPMSKPVTSPFGTVTQVDHHALVSLPFTVDYHGNGRASGIDRPLPTQDSRDRHALVDPAIEVDDCGFRMLEPHEIGRAMAFPQEYKVLGNKRDRVRQFGQAVTPPVMKMILERCVESLS